MGIGHMHTTPTDIRALEFAGDRLRLVDQRRLPRELCHFDCLGYEDCIFAIKDMVVRGAPAIGAAAAYGVVLAARSLAVRLAGRPAFELRAGLHKACAELKAARPTAVNLMWAVDRMAARLACIPDADLPQAGIILLKEADDILADETSRSERISLHGNGLVPAGATILTHCNTGSLAVPGPGTALGIIKAAHRAGKGISVYADETRPRLQGARLTAWELVREGIPATLIADSVAATLLRDGAITLVVVGADRIAANGDSANKIGTFMLSALARLYQVPFYIAAPVSTIDFGCPDGSAIVIEERDPDEVSSIESVRVAAEGIRVYNPAFDVTPADNISAIISEAGILYPPFSASIAALRRS